MSFYQSDELIYYFVRLILDAIYGITFLMADVLQIFNLSSLPLFIFFSGKDMRSKHTDVVTPKTATGFSLSAISPKIIVKC